MALDWDGSVIPGSTVNKRNKVGTTIVAPKSSVSTLPAHSQYVTAATPVVPAVTSGVGANPYQAFTNRMLGTSYGNQAGLAGNTYNYTNTAGTQGALDLTKVLDPSTGATSDVTSYITPEVTDAINNPTIGSLGQQGGLAGTLSSGLDSIGGAKGFADLAGGLGALGSLYTGYKQNKMAEQEHDARMGELKRQRQRDVDWEKNINASGLGTYTSGLAQKSAGAR